MFSAAATAPDDTSLRNPRRRQRTGSDGSLATRQAPKRQKRSALAPDTFKPPHKDKLNGYPDLINGASKANRHATESANHGEKGFDDTSLAIRSKGSKRAERGKKGAKLEDGIVQVSLYPEILLDQAI